MRANGAKRRAVTHELDWSAIGDFFCEIITTINQSPKNFTRNMPGKPTVEQVTAAALCEGLRQRLEEGFFLRTP